MSEIVLAWAWPAVRAIGILLVAWYAGRWARAPLDRFLLARLDPTLRAFLVAAAQPVALLLAVPPALDALHVSMSSALAVLSTAGLAIALALRDSLSNVASGALLLTVRPFRVGDLVTVAGIHGKVRRVGLLLLEIDAEDGRRVSITNDKVLASPIERHAADGVARVELLVRVPAGLATAPRVADARASAERLTPGPVELVPVEVEQGFVRFAVRAWGPPAESGEIRARLLDACSSLLTPDRDGDATSSQHR